MIDDTLINNYDWEVAPDTNTTWRIGDGTAAFYNYIYYTVAGFTEHDTFRSNQIREGDLSREEALYLVEDENRPRYPNIKWYLDAIGMDFEDVIPVITPFNLCMFMTEATHLVFGISQNMFLCLVWGRWYTRILHYAGYLELVIRQLLLPQILITSLNHLSLPVLILYRILQV